MQLSWGVYLADFIVYPLAVVALAAAGLSTATYPSGWVVTALAGLAAWTLVEYLLHRFMFHHLPMVERMHEDHHENPRAMIGSPVWLSLLIFAFVAVPPLWLAIGPNLTSAVMAGLMAGYLWYMVVHHAVHHWAIDERSWLYTARIRHLLHHYRSDACSFGVTTGFWDYVFGTVQQPRRAKPQLPLLDQPPQ